MHKQVQSWREGAAQGPPISSSICWNTAPVNQKARYARGEISREEYEQMRRDLEDFTSRHIVCPKFALYDVLTKIHNLNLILISAGALSTYE